MWQFKSLFYTTDKSDNQFISLVNSKRQEYLTLISCPSVTYSTRHISQQKIVKMWHESVTGMNLSLLYL